MEGMTEEAPPYGSPEKKKISDRAKALVTMMEESDYLANPFRDRAALLELVQKYLDEAQQEDEKASLDDDDGAETGGES